MPAIPFDPSNPSIAAARQIVFARLRAEPDWHQLDDSAAGFDAYVQYPGETSRGRSVLAVYATEVFWQFLIEGILTPGMDRSNLQLPWFRVTDYGRQVLADAPFQPHDPTGYLAAVQRRIGAPDPTVMAYLAESVENHRRGTLVASTVMLGVAAERVFDLVCDSILAALANPAERTQFQGILERYPMKPKLDWVARKLQTVHGLRLPGFPDNAPMMVGVIYDLLRTQRNDLGHPRDLPPAVDREQAYANLQIFPTYYSTAESLRQFLTTNTV